MSEEQPYMPGVPVTCDSLAESSFSPTVGGSALATEKALRSKGNSIEGEEARGAKLVVKAAPSLTFIRACVCVSACIYNPACCVVDH